MFNDISIIIRQHIGTVTIDSCVFNFRFIIVIIIYSLFRSFSPEFVVEVAILLCGVVCLSSDSILFYFCQTADDYY